MPQLFTVFITEVDADGEVTRSEEGVIALYDEGETIDPNDGADLRVVDADGDGKVSRTEFRDSTGGGGLGLNGGAESAIYDGAPNGPGTLYSQESYAVGDNIADYIKSLPSNYPPVELENLAVCFTLGTLMSTPEGPRAIETLTPGDLVITSDHGPQPLRWIGRKTLITTEKSRAVRIAAGALGDGLPTADLVVSPQHRILVTSRAAKRLFGDAEALVTARKLLPLDGVSEEPLHQVTTYLHLVFDAHEVVYANGAPAESLYLGETAFEMLDDDAIDELIEIFGEDLPGTHLPILNGKDQKRLVAAHERNGRSVIETV
ncbi:Hint domain-containing protein [Paracoccaceae bacterium GXU_MW_L88]